MKRQRGIGLFGLIAVLAVIAFLAVISLKLLPPYIEYFAVKRSLIRIAHQPDFFSLSKQEVAAQFGKSALIDNISSVNPAALEISQTRAGVSVVSVDYRVTVPLFANISVLLDFHASSSTARSVGT